MFSSEGAQRVLAGIVFLNIYVRRMDGLRNTSSSCRSPSTFVLLKKKHWVFRLCISASCATDAPESLKNSF